MCGRPHEFKSFGNDFGGRIDCVHLSGLWSRHVSTGPDQVRDPVPSNLVALDAKSERVIRILGSTDRHLHLVVLFRPGIAACVNRRLNVTPPLFALSI